ncbi:MAG TPA: DEAD/DEAH box helicase, partial [Ktedonobacteraceae bacterium]|nr:DEAD/DEAH box helicase [Ktedonobacteraceae bacterium]
MPDLTTTQLAPLIERARKVLQYEQRGNHQDRVVKGGLELFVVRWADEISAVCKKAGLDLKPIYRFTENLEGYRRQDPMQRASSLRTALSVLNELEHSGTAIHAQTGNNSGKASPHTTKPSSMKDDLGEARKDFGEEKLPQNAQPPVSTHLDNLTSRSPDKSSETKEGTPQQSSKSLDSHERAPISLEAGMSSGHASLTLLSAEITAVPGVGPSIAAKLRSLGIRTIRDLLFYFPRQHRDYSKLEKIANIPFSEVATTLGLIWEVETFRSSKGLARTIATISDDTGKLRVTWFNQSYLQKQLQAAKGSYLVVTGVKQRFGNKIEFTVKSHELPEKGDLLNTGRLVPNYALTEGLNAKSLRRFTKWVVDRYAAMIPEFLPTSIRSAARLMPLPEAVSQMHYPENEQALQAARLRLGFDELFLIQLGMQERRSRWQREAPQGNAFKIDFNKILIDTSDLTAITSAQTAHNKDTQQNPTLPGNTLWSMLAIEKPFEETLPFRFTEAQRCVIIEIFGDLAQSQPMCRLLQGDVGAGKTAVAAAALLMAALNGYQGAIMAPTELLAEQHAQSIGSMLEPFGIHTVLLTGSLRQRERAFGHAAIENGEGMVAIGT